MLQVYIHAVTHQYSFLAKVHYLVRYSSVFPFFSLICITPKYTYQCNNNHFIHLLTRYWIFLSNTIQTIIKDTHILLCVLFSCFQWSSIIMYLITRLSHQVFFSRMYTKNITALMTFYKFHHAYQRQCSKISRQKKTGRCHGAGKSIRSFYLSI